MQVTQEKMKTESNNNNGFSVVVGDGDVTSVNDNTNFGNINGCLSNPHQRRNIRRSSTENCDLRIESIDDDHAFHKAMQTGDVSDHSNNNFILSGQQNNLLVKKATERRPSGESKENVYLNKVDLTLKLEDNDPAITNDTNPNLTQKCTQRRDTLESNYLNDIKQIHEEPFHQKQHNFENEGSFKNQSQNISCPVFRSVTNHIQGNEHINSCAQSSVVDTELEMEQDVRSFLEEGKHNSIDDIDFQANKPEALIKLNKEGSKQLPDYLQALTEGKQVCGDSYVEFSKPHWLDEEKFTRGQRFARDHLFGIMFSDLVSLMILFAFRRGLEPLIFTGQSDTPFKAFQRYLSTNVRVSSWYEGDIWDANTEAHRNLKTVRAMHETTRRRMNSGNKEEVAKKVTLEDDKGTRPMWTDLHEDIREGFQKSCPFFSSPSSYPNETYVNQCDMAITQFGFMGLVLVYPKMFGIFDVTDEDLEGYIHFWRTIFYLLGGEDRFNLCNGDLATVSQRCVDLIELWVKPEFRLVSRDWMHMSRVMVQGVSFYIIGLSFEVLLLYLCKVLNIKAEKLSSLLTFKQRLQYYNICFVFWFLMRFVVVWNFMNWLVRLAIKATLDIRPERLERIKQRVYPYETT